MSSNCQRSRRQVWRRRSLWQSWQCFGSLYDFQKAIEYHSLCLQIAKEVGDKSGEGGAYGNLGNAFQSLGDFQKAIEYHSLCLQIAKEVGDKSVEGGAYGNLGNAFDSLSDFQKAIEYHSLCLQIAKEVGDKSGHRTSSWQSWQCFSKSR